MTGPVWEATTTEKLSDPPYIGGGAMAEYRGTLTLAPGWCFRMSGLCHCPGGRGQARRWADLGFPGSNRLPRWSSGWTTVRGTQGISDATILGSTTHAFRQRRRRGRQGCTRSRQRHRLYPDCPRRDHDGEHYGADNEPVEVHPPGERATQHCGSACHMTHFSQTGQKCLAQPVQGEVPGHPGRCHLCRHAMVDNRSAPGELGHPNPYCVGLTWATRRPTFRSG